MSFIRRRGKPLGRTLAGRETLDAFRQSNPEAPTIGAWVVRGRLPAPDVAPHAEGFIELWDQVRAAEKSIRYGAAHYAADGQLEDLLLLAVYPAGEFLEVVSGGRVSRFRIPAPIASWDHWEQFSVEALGQALEHAATAPAGAPDSSQRVRADEHASFVAFRENGPAPQLLSWRVVSVSEADDDRLGGGRVEFWGGLDTVGPFVYAHMAVAYRSDGSIAGICAIELMPETHDDVFLCLFQGDQHTNFGLRRDLLDASSFATAAIEVLGSLLRDETPRPLVVPPTPVSEPFRGDDAELPNEPVSRQPVAHHNASATLIHWRPNEVWDRTRQGDLRIGPFLVLQNFLTNRDLSGGAFGSVFAVLGPNGESAVAKAGRALGGGRGNTHADAHHPDVGAVISEDGWVHVTFGPQEVDEVLRSEGLLLERAGGALLPKSYGLYDDPWGRPVLVMEQVEGRPPRDVDDVVAILSAIAEAVDEGVLDYHGDLKPEHVFIGNQVRLIDPAPRFAEAAKRAYTPEYNPYALTGRVADVFAIAVLLYLILTAIHPFSRMYGSDSTGVEDPPPVARGRQEIPGRIATFVDSIVRTSPNNLPEWAYDYRSALERLRG
jgi:hypothetical protein